MEKVLMRRAPILAAMSGLVALLSIGCDAGESSGGPGVASSSTAGAGGGASGSGGAGGAGGSGGAGGGTSSTYTTQAFDKTRITSDSSQPNFQKVFADIDFHDGPFASVKLIVDLESTCYPFDKWKDNPPPQGQSWPADCDAFDRNFDVALDTSEEPMAPPGLELAHAITPFGGPLHLEVDITDVANGLPGKHSLRAYIATWSDAEGKVSGSKGGWNVSAKIEATPGAAPRKVLAVQSLFYGSVTVPDGEPLTFEVPEGAVSGKIEYRTSGHGGGDAGPGCIGPAEEFCKRTHTLSLDGNPLPTVTPWRTDCKSLCTSATYTWPSGQEFTYCEENPCGAISSVKAPRANWCPGSMTAPYVWEDKPELGVPGPHTFQWKISTVASGGLWANSVTYFAYGKP
jgi:hypothetical protein